ncbi:MAG: NUDIX domain-containing protein [Candidatus Levybacteria bacterium]|nr:NUDIX domain-containing protein [Candidatus Levybacteria bacterium]
MKRGVDYIGVGIGAVIINREGKVFLEFRGKKARNEKAKWACPGGGLEFGESMKDSIVREMKEEYGFEIEPLEQMDAIDHIIPKEKQHWIAIGYLCKVKRGTPKILEPEKCEKIGWFTIEEMAKMPLAIPTKHRLMGLRKKYLGKLKKLYLQ